MTYSQNKQNQNIGFGNFDTKETREYVKKNILNPNTDDMGCSRDAFEYLDKTPFVTIKRKKGITYAVLNRKAAEGHKHKDRLLGLLKDYSHCVRGILAKRSKEAGILDAEPDFLCELDGVNFQNKNGSFKVANKAMRNLYQDIEDAETGYIHKSSPSEPEYEKSALEIIDEKYGFH